MLMVLQAGEGMQKDLKKNLYFVEYFQNILFWYFQLWNWK